MRYRNESIVALVVAMLVATAPASAQAPVADAAKKALADAANALGMVRGVERSLTIVNMFEFTAHGTIAGANGAPQHVTRITADYDYVIPAARVEIEKTGPDGSAQRSIEVAAGTLAWDAATPGIYMRHEDVSAAERVRRVRVLEQNRLDQR